MHQSQTARQFRGEFARPSSLSSFQLGALVSCGFGFSSDGVGVNGHFTLTPRRLRAMIRFLPDICGTRSPLRRAGQRRDRGPSRPFTRVTHRECKSVSAAAATHNPFRRKNLTRDGAIPEKLSSDDDRGENRHPHPRIRLT